jgi:PEP-CTERM motif
MTKQKSLMVAMAGAALLAASQAQAQLSPAYTTGDLLLNFRNTANLSAADLTIDLGSVSTFAAIPGGTYDLNSGGSALPSITTVDSALSSVAFTAGELQTAYGSSLTGIALSGAALTSDSDFVTRSQTSTAAGSKGSSGVQSQNTFANAVGNTGAGASGLDATTATSLDNGNRGASVASAQSFSYEAQATHSSSVINWNGAFVTTTAGGGTMETAGLSSSAVYAGLWTSDQAGDAGTDLGYFTFNPNGEVDFTSLNPVSAVPEPSTYGLIAGVGLLAVAFRRQLRVLNA